MVHCPLGYQQVTFLLGATGLTSVPAGTAYIVVTVECAGIRWRDDGIAPQLLLECQLLLVHLFHIQRILLKFNLFNKLPAQR